MCSSDLRDGGERIVLRHDSHAPITFDPNHLRQILVNLLFNGLRYASDCEGAVLLPENLREKAR